MKNQLSGYQSDISIISRNIARIPCFVVEFRDNQHYQL